MSTAIDSAGRLVIPKSVREAMGLTPGTPIDVVFVDGRIQIEFAPLDVEVDVADGLPRIVPQGADGVSLDDAQVRAALESTRR